MATEVKFVNRAHTRQSVKVFYGPTAGFCVDKPLRSNFTIEPGKEHALDVGPDLICYCNQDAQLGVPPENCGHQQARPGDTIELF